MPARLRLQITETELTLSPGESAELRFSLANVGEVVDSFSLSIVGLTPGWYTLSDDEVGLFPGDAVDLVLKVHPRQDRSVPAGAHPFSLIAQSQDDPTERTVVQLTLNLRAMGDLTLELHPQRVRGRKGLYTITLSNPGNAPIQTVLAGTDPDEGLSYSLGTPIVQEAQPGENPQVIAFGKVTLREEGYFEHEPELPPFSETLIPILVKPCKRVWTGNQRIFTFEVGTHPPGVDWEPAQARRVGGELLYPPMFEKWANLPANIRRALAYALPVALLLILLLLVWPKEQPAPEPAPDVVATAIAFARQTQTAVAASRAAGNNQTPGTSGAPTPSSGTDGDGDGRGAGNSGGGGDESGVPQVNAFRLVMPPLADGLFGEALYLEWDVTGVEEVSIADDTGPPSLTNLSTASQIDYTLLATGTQRSVTSTASLIIVPPPSIELFQGIPLTTTVGQDAAVEWRVRGATSVRLDRVPAGLDGEGYGSATVRPEGTHNYLLCASNLSGEVCRSVKITVLPPNTPTVPPAPPTATATPVRAAATATPIVRPRATATRPPARPTATVRQVQPSRTPTKPPPPTATKPAPTNTRVPTNTPLATPTRTVAPTHTAAATATLTRTPSRTPTSTYTLTPSRTPTFTVTPTITPTDTPRPTDTATPTWTHTATPTYTQTASPTVTATPTVVCFTWRYTDPRQFEVRSPLTSTLSIPQRGIIADVNVVGLDVSLANRMDHQYPFDLVSPQGTRVHLFDWFCEGPNAIPFSRLVLNLDDQASAPITDIYGMCAQQVVTGTYRPVQPLAFAGQQAGGRWNLLINGSQGELRSAMSRNPVAEWLFQVPPTRTPTPSPTPVRNTLYGWGLQICYRTLEGP